MRKFLRQWRIYFVYTGLFSFFVNVLQLTFPIYMLQIYDRVLSSQSMPTLWAITVGAVGCLVVMAGLDFVRSRLLVRAGIAIDESLSRTVLSSMLKDAGQIGSQGYSQGLRDVNTLRNFFSGNAIFAIFDIPWTPMYLILIYILHPVLGMVATGGGVVICILGVLSDKLSRKPIEQANVVSNAAQRFTGTALQNAHAVQSMGMITGVTEHWEKMNRVLVGLQTRASKRAGLLQSITKSFRVFMQVSIYGVGAYLTLTQASTAGCMIAASILMGRALQPIEMGMGTWKSFIEARSAYNRLDTLFSAPPAQEPMELPAPSGAISAEHVSFVAGGKPLLQNISFALQPGESMGLIGPSAAGKSSLAKVLLGIWPASAGKVRLDGADIASWNFERLGPYIGYLPQDVELFSGTVGDNIARLGEKDSDRIIDAARKAGVHDMVLHMPKGYDTPVGPGGMALSGGQRQRIGLARALYGDPKLIILDEPNASLDEEGENALLQAMEALKRLQSTVIMITHKPSLLSGVDKILLVKNGQLAMFGPREAVFQKLQTSNVTRMQQTAS